MTKRKISLILISLIAILGGAGLTFYITQLNKTLQATQTELTAAEEQVATLQGDLTDWEETINTKNTEIAEKDQALSDREEDLEQKESEIEEKEAEINQQKQTLSRERNEVNRLKAANQGLKENMGTVVSCFGGISAALITNDPLVAYSAMDTVSRECEEASDIVDELDI